MGARRQRIDRQNASRVIERILKPPLLQQHTTEAESRIRVVIVLGEQLAIDLFRALKITGTQSLIGATTRLVVVVGNCQSNARCARQTQDYQADDQDRPAPRLFALVFHDRAISESRLSSLTK